MIRFLWRLLGRNYWIKLSSHYSQEYPGKKLTLEKYFYAEWEQKKGEIRRHKVYELIGESS